MKTAIVVGGGISGILGAILLAKKYKNVYLVEKSDRCGGLLKSFQSANGVTFDYGTHMLQETGIRTLDSILFDKVAQKKWYYLDFLRAGSYFRGHLNENNSFIDARALPGELYQRGLVELLGLSSAATAFPNAQAHLEKFFGKTFTEYIFQPVMKKLFGCDLEELAPGAHKLFGLTRVTVLNPQITRELKKIPSLDHKLAFHSFKEGASSLKSYYPRQGGIGALSDDLVRKASSKGVRVLTNEHVEKVLHRNRRVTSVVLGGGQEISVDLVLWTIAPYFCAKAAGINVISSPPLLRTTSLYHFIFDAPFLTHLHYLTCYDESIASFRVTMYSNIGAKSRQRRPYSCTVEVISGPIHNLSVMKKNVARELVGMGLISKRANIIFSAAEVVPEGFPVLTRDFTKILHNQTKILERSLKNVIFLGKARGDVFFIGDVLKDTYDRIISH